MDKPRTSELARAAGISTSYSSEILSGARRPSRGLAIHIFRKTGWRHDLISNLSDDQLSLLEEVDPYAAPVLACAACERRADDPTVTSCARTDCGLRQKEAA